MSSEILEAVIKHGMGVPEIKELVIQILKNEEERIRPKREFQEVWRQESDARDLAIPEAVRPGSGKPSEMYKLVQIVIYHHRERIAKCVYLLATRPNEFYNGYSQVVAEEVGAFAEYTTAIAVAQIDFKKRLRWFNDLTEVPEWDKDLNGRYEYSLRVW